MLRRPTAALGLAVLLFAAPTLAETRSHLQGDVRPVAPFVPLDASVSLFNAPGEPIASFWLDADPPELDFRVAPGAIVIATQSGSLAAVASDSPTLYGVLPRDAESGRPLKVASAEGATCPTGAEPDCWVVGERIPIDPEVEAALDAFVPPLVQPAIAWDPTSPEMQALLGCGPFWGTDCAATGVDLHYADASVLLQSWPLPGLHPVTPVISERVVDPLSGRPRRPSSRTSERPSNLGIDGSSVRVRWSVRPGGNAEFGRRDFVWSNPLATLSWNYLILLVSMSGEFDPTQPYAPNGCSYAAPQYCSSVQEFFLFFAELLDDDPNAPPRLRFVWESGALYDVIETTGDLSPYAGGTVHVLGLERARNRVAAVGVPLVLFPAGATLDPATPFAVATPDAPEAPSFGLAYATAPEPAAGGLGLAVALSLAARARWRSRTRR